MCLCFSSVPTILVSLPKAAAGFLETHDLIFASRPHLEASKYMMYEQRNISFSPYSTYWRIMRKLCTLDLLSNLKICSFQSMRKEELGLLIQAAILLPRLRP
ncbi:hypothetical protein Vadar_028179 [Vaccinium darrowii]|uniref:Uncharacterized protein n=1 Tax=Vaccinium darrowii TaxID=229202 RepID=A0ACB7Z780_9ERIC|nr:hypothetical protein Vadar_028179 [Vaccinium darrowii]